jgi:hypothetical protein
MQSMNFPTLKSDVDGSAQSQARSYLIPYRMLEEIFSRLFGVHVSEGQQEFDYMEL